MIPNHAMAAAGSDPRGVSPGMHVPAVKPPAVREVPLSPEPLTAEGLFRRHGKDVFRIVRRLLGPGAPEADVEDLTQQAFLAVHRDLARFRGEAAPTTWLYAIASRTVLMHLRSWRRRARLAEAFALEARAEDQAPSADNRLGHQQELHRVWRCLLKVRPKKRVVFILHEIEGLSGKEIAEALDIKEATVWTRLYHARRELLEKLDKERSP